MGQRKGSPVLFWSEIDKSWGGSYKGQEAPKDVECQEQGKSTTQARSGEEGVVPENRGGDESRFPSTSLSPCSAASWPFFVPSQPSSKTIWFSRPWITVASVASYSHFSSQSDANRWTISPSGESVATFQFFNFSATDFKSKQGWTTFCSLAAGLQENGERMRKWRGNGERMRIWRGNGKRCTFYISSFSLYFPPLYPFPISKIVIFCRKMLNKALLTRMSQKN